MPVTPSRHIRLTDAEWSQLAELGQRLGPEKPLTQSDVIRVLIRRAAASLTAPSQTTHRNRRPRSER